VSGELDHLVPLELGGSNDTTNLWVEAGPLPNPKDAVEDALNREVCDGTLSLRAAQREIAQNWLMVAGSSASRPAARPLRPGRGHQSGHRRRLPPEVVHRQLLPG
jgi:hypothetical protein